MSDDEDIAYLRGRNQAAWDEIRRLNRRIYPGQGEGYANEVERQRYVIENLQRIARKYGADRDAARAAADRVRALHYRRDVQGYAPLTAKDGEVLSEGGPPRSVCEHCQRSWPCPTRAALDGPGE